MIVSVTADQKIRFWDFDVTSGKQPVFTLYGDHDKLDSLTAVATDEDNDYILTGDTAGCIKLWDISAHRFRTDLTSDNMNELWFI
jgi:WD40 repeat protein